MANSGRPIWRRLLKWSVVSLALILVVLSAVLTALLKPYYQQAQQYDLEIIENQPKLPYDSLPQHLIHAVVAAEDSRFFEHQGVDTRGVARAALANWRAKTKVQGGSTITQQLAKQSFGINQRTIKRKLVEMFVARRIEKRFDKQAILTSYLSLIYYGNGFNGIRTAAQGYYQKDVSELTVDEAATLVGLLKAPSLYEPFDHPARAKKARNLVLRRMADEKMLSREEALQYQEAPLRPVREERI